MANDKEPNIRAKIIVVDRTKALEHYAKIKSNRDLSAKHVNAFVRLIMEGKFRDYGVIFFNHDGSAFDGQHRFQAIIRTGHTAKFIAIYGLEAQDLNMLIDSGRNRTHAQRLAKMGYANASTLASAVSICMQQEFGWRLNSSMVFIDEIVGYVESYPEIVTYVNMWSKDKRSPVPAALLAASQLLFGRSDPTKVDAFMMALASGDAEDGHPALAFRKMLNDLPLDEAPHRRNLYIQNGINFAWNAFKRGESLDEIKPTMKPVKIE